MDRSVLDIDPDYGSDPISTDLCSDVPVLPHALHQLRAHQRVERRSGQKAGTVAPKITVTYQGSITKGSQYQLILVAF